MTNPTKGKAPAYLEKDVTFGVPSILESSASKSTESKPTDSKAAAKGEIIILIIVESVIESIAAQNHKEPAPGVAETTRIQLRMPDGSRKVRRYHLDEPIRHIFECAKYDNEALQAAKFELTFHRTRLIDQLDTTIKEAGLANAAIQVEIVA